MVIIPMKARSTRCTLDIHLATNLPESEVEVVVVVRQSRISRLWPAASLRKLCAFRIPCAAASSHSNTESRSVSYCSIRTFDGYDARSSPQGLTASEKESRAMYEGTTAAMPTFCTTGDNVLIRHHERRSVPKSAFITPANLMIGALQ